MMIHRANEQLTPFYDDVSGRGRKSLHEVFTHFSTYFTLWQTVSGKQSHYDMAQPGYGDRFFSRAPSVIDTSLWIVILISY